MMRRLLLIGCMLVLCLTAACRSTPLAEEEERLYSPSSSVNLEAASTDESEGVSNTEFELKLAVQGAEDGFRLKLVGTDNIYVSQTIMSPLIGDTSYVVHEIRTHFSEQLTDGETIRRDIAVVNPDKTEVTVYPLYRALVDDMYSPDSVAKSYGFLDDRHLLYVAVVNESDIAADYYYRIEKLNIATGESTVIVPRLPDVPEGDHFAHGWLNAAKETLVLNSYSSGKLWSINVITGDIISPEERISHPWPFFATAPSPDGERFWHTDYRNRKYRLYDKAGTKLAEMAVEQQYVQYPAFLWSTDSRYAAFLGTYDQNDQIPVLLEDSELEPRAMQQAQFIDRNGTKVMQFDTEQGRYIEMVGWLPGASGSAIVHSYNIEKNADEAWAVKTHSTYSVVDIDAGAVSELKEVTDPAMLEQPVPITADLNAYGSKPSLYIADMELGLIHRLSEYGVWLPSSDDHSIEWTMYEDGAGDTAYYNKLDWASGKLDVMSVKGRSFEFDKFNDRWLVGAAMDYVELK